MFKVLDIIFEVLGSLVGDIVAAPKSVRVLLAIQLVALGLLGIFSWGSLEQTRIDVAYWKSQAKQNWDFYESRNTEAKELRRQLDRERNPELGSHLVAEPSPLDSERLTEIRGLLLEANYAFYELHDKPWASQKMVQFATRVVEYDGAGGQGTTTEPITSELMKLGEPFVTIRHGFFERFPITRIEIHSLPRPDLQREK